MQSHSKVIISATQVNKHADSSSHSKYTNGVSMLCSSSSFAAQHSVSHLVKQIWCGIALLKVLMQQLLQDCVDMKSFACAQVCVLTGWLASIHICAESLHLPTRPTYLQTHQSSMTKLLMGAPAPCQVVHGILVLCKYVCSSTCTVITSVDSCVTS